MSTTASAGAPPVDHDGDDEAPAQHEQRTDVVARRMAIAATLAAITPILVAAIRGVRRGWMPTGDDSYVAVRAWDVFTSHPPLLSTWSSASAYAGRDMNHPGPLQFDLLAVPVRLFGYGPGLALGIAVLSSAAVVTLAWLVARQLGSAAAALAAGACALLAWSMGSEMLYDPWNLHASVIPFALFTVAVWCAAAGDRVALPIMVVAGTYVLQMHLSFTILVPVMALFALTVAGVLLTREHDRRAALRWTGITGATALVCWAQPLYEQLTADGEGNLTRLVRSGGAEASTPTLGQAIRAYGGTVAIPPAWLPPSFGSPSFRLDGTGRPTWLAAAALVLVAAALVVLGWRALQRRSHAIAAGSATALLALVLGFVTTLRIPLRLGFVPFYLRFAWPLAMVVWLVLVLAVVEEVRQRRPAWLAVPSRRLAIPGLALALVGCVAALPTVDNGATSFPWSIDASDAIDDDVVAAVRDRGPVLVEFSSHTSVQSVGPAVFVMLQDAGIPFYVTDHVLIRQLGDHRRFEPGDAGVRLFITGDPHAAAGSGAELVAAWSPLSDTEEDELAELTDDLRAIVADNGIPLRPGAQALLEDLHQDRLLDDVATAQDNPEDAVDLGTLSELWASLPAAADVAPLPDPDVFEPEMMDRWTDLLIRRENQSVSVLATSPPR